MGGYTRKIYTAGQDSVGIDEEGYELLAEKIEIDTEIEYIALDT